MRLMISVVATVALVAVAISMLRSRPPSIELSAASMPSLSEFREPTPLSGGRGSGADLSGRHQAIRKIMLGPAD